MGKQMRNTGFRIMADGIRINNDTMVTGLNNNDCIVGPPGAGKTRNYVLPNILQCAESMVITDAKGVLRQQAGNTLERNGYKIYELNFIDVRASTVGYNPLHFIRYDTERGHYLEQDILRVSTCLVPDELETDPFWHRAARMLLETFVAYILEAQPRDEHTLDNVALLLSEINGLTNQLLDEFVLISPDSFTARRWKLYKSMAQAEKMTASIQGILAEKLSVLTFDAISELFTKKNQIDFAMLGREKSALFLTISDTDRSLDSFAALLYSQILQELCDEADKNEDHRLRYPVRLYLDDFACHAIVPDFDKLIAVIRSRDISVSIVLQSLSQLEGLYGKAKASVILNCCDNMLYLGGNDPETAKFISIRAKKSVNTILTAPLEDAWLFTRGMPPEQVRKFRLSDHPNYRDMPGQDDDDMFDEDLPF